ncbi:hypothetical protein FA15DRAFT_671303 [Coprinopsis marcescibilis]|uniref:F-box domain-containing protein n=1 Tax=Coprinopsis marcescibilis TaxID=230819 RepID=A0A5C3KR92_COPMA|nr:hypothetical protein FA15DRAFT_671303 [Coprinopsis marcescibilis]
MPKKQNPSEDPSEISTLPTELVRLIFSHSAQNSRDQYDHDLAQRSPQLPTEVVLSHVCSDWRFIALNLHKIWSSFTIYHVPSNPAPLARVNQLQVYLERSIPAPLDLKFHFEGASIADARNLEADVLQLAAEHAGRWKHIVINMIGVKTPLQLAPFVVLFRDLRAPQLEHFELFWTFPRRTTSSFNPGPRTPIATLLPRILLQGCPKLTYLGLSLSSSGLFLPPITTCHNLTALDLNQPDTGDTYLTLTWPAFKVVMSLPLIALSLAEGVISTWLEENIADFSNTAMPYLKHLRWHGYDRRTRTSSRSSSWATTSFLGHLNAPMLKTLSIRSLQNTWCSEEFMPNLASVETLYLANCYRPDPDLIPSLAKGTPNVTKITIQDESRHGMQDYVFQCLLGDWGERGGVGSLDTVWKKLKEIDVLIVGNSSGPLNTPQYLEFMEQQRNGRRQQTQLRFRFSKKIHDELRACDWSWREVYSAEYADKAGNDLNSLRSSCDFGYITDQDYHDFSIGNDWYLGAC